MEFMDGYFSSLKTFCSDVVSDIGIVHSELYGIPAPCIPYTFGGYQSAERKIFYLGKETYGWIPMQRLLDLYENDRLDLYIAENSKVIASPEAMIRYSGNKNNFWTFVIKMQLYLRTKEMISDVYSLTDRQMGLLDEIGYGNTNAIESVRSNGIDWTLTSQSTYDRVKGYSRKIDSLKCLLDIYCPDLIVISNWEDCNEFFDGVEITHLEQHYINNLRAVYSIKGYDTKILWTSHPRRYSFLGYNINRAIEKIAEIF